MECKAVTKAFGHLTHRYTECAFFFYFNFTILYWFCQWDDLGERH